RHLSVAFLLASPGVDPKELWGSLNGFILLQAFQVVGLILGGLLAGAGQRQGAVYGAVLGIWNGVLLVLVQPASTPFLNTMILYALPLMQAALGALAGWLGSRVWSPLTPAGGPVPLRKAKPKRKGLPWFAGPIYWARVIMGTSLAVGGALWAGALF